MLHLFHNLHFNWNFPNHIEPSTQFWKKKKNPLCRKKKRTKNKRPHCQNIIGVDLLYFTNIIGKIIWFCCNVTSIFCLLACFQRSSLKAKDAILPSSPTSLGQSIFLTMFPTMLRKCNFPLKFKSSKNLIWQQHNRHTLILLDGKLINSNDFPKMKFFTHALDSKNGGCSQKVSIWHHYISINESLDPTSIFSSSWMLKKKQHGCRDFY